MFRNMGVSVSSGWAVAVLLAGGLVVSAGVLGGCDKPDSSERSAGGVEGERAEGGEQGARFGASIQQEQCELLTAEMVAEIFEVSADRLEQEQVSPGYPCVYSWEDEGRELTAELGQIEVRDSAEDAADWFGQMTQDLSEEEVKEVMGEIVAEAEERGELESEEQKAAALEVGEGLGSGGFSFEKVEGLGDEAVFDVKSAQIRVRVDNLIFRAGAYYGESMPAPQTSDLQEMLEEVAKFQQATRDEREAQSIQLAEAILEKLEAR